MFDSFLFDSSSFYYGFTSILLLLYSINTLRHYTSATQEPAMIVVYDNLYPFHIPSIL